MKRLISIIACLVLLLGGVATAFAICKQIQLAAVEDHNPSVSNGAHDTSADSNHEHSDESVHCLTVEQSGVVALFPTRPDRGPERLLNPIVAESVFSNSNSRSHNLLRGPPVFAGISSSVPTHLFHSVLLI